jgi:hypothetical protein
VAKNVENETATNKDEVSKSRALPTSEAWQVLNEVLETFSPVLFPFGRTRFHDLLEAHLRRFSPDAISEAHGLVGRIRLAIETGQDQELGRALIGILSQGTEKRRAGVVNQIRICATRHKEGDPDAVEVLVALLSPYDPAFKALREKVPNLAEWLGRVHAKGKMRIAPEYCAAVLSVETGAFDDKPSPLNDKHSDNYRDTAKKYTKAVDKHTKAREKARNNESPSRPPPPNVYEATDHKEMLVRAIATGWISRGEALVDDVSDDGVRLAVRPAPEFAALTLEELRARLREAEGRAEKLRWKPPILVGVREKRAAKSAGKRRPPGR